MLTSAKITFTLLFLTGIDHIYISSYQEDIYMCVCVCNFRNVSHISEMMMRQLNVTLVQIHYYVNVFIRNKLKVNTL